MYRRLLGLLAAASLGTATLTAAGMSAASAAPARPKLAVDYTGIVALSNCSGSLVRTPDAADSDPALVLTNGHCYEGGMPSAGQVITNQPSSRTFSLLDPSGQGTLGTLHATTVLYSTMTDTDVTLYKLDTTYAAIQQTYNTPALQLSTTTRRPAPTCASSPATGGRRTRAAWTGSRTSSTRTSGRGRTRSATRPRATSSAARRAPRSSTPLPARSSRSTTRSTRTAKAAR